MSKTAAPACKEHGGGKHPPYMKEVCFLHFVTCLFLPCILTFPQNLLK